MLLADPEDCCEYELEDKFDCEHAAEHVDEEDDEELELELEPLLDELLFEFLLEFFELLLSRLGGGGFELPPQFLRLRGPST